MAAKFGSSLNSEVNMQLLNTKMSIKDEKDYQNDGQNCENLNGMHFNDYEQNEVQIQNDVSSKTEKICIKEESLTNEDIYETNFPLHAEGEYVLRVLLE